MQQRHIPIVRPNPYSGAGSTDISSVSAPRPRRKPSLSTSAVTAFANASTGPVDNHRNRDIPIDTSVASNASSSAHRCGVNSRESVGGFGLSLLTGVGDSLHHCDRTRPDHPRRDQILAREPEQQCRRIVRSVVFISILTTVCSLRASPAIADVGLCTLSTLAATRHGWPATALSCA